MRLTIIELVLLFVLFPAAVLLDSWKRLGRVGWEWALLGFLLMSIWGALMQDVIFPLWLKERTFFNLWLARLMLFGGASCTFTIYMLIEVPVLKKGRVWYWLRALAATVLAIKMGESMAETFDRGYLSSHKTGTMMIASTALFLISQVGLFFFRDKDRIAAWQRQQQVERESHESQEANRETSSTSD